MWAVTSQRLCRSPVRICFAWAKRSCCAAVEKYFYSSQQRLRCVVQKETREYNNPSRHRKDVTICFLRMSKNATMSTQQPLAGYCQMLLVGSLRIVNVRKSLSFLFLKNAMSNFIPSDSSVFAFCHVSCFYGESSRPERTANMRINRRYCKFFGKNWCSFFEEDENRCFCNALNP